MATHDYVIDNSTGANVRSDINNVLQAILTNNSSSSAPSTTAAYMWWADTTTGILKIRNSANDAWVELLQLDGTLTLEDGSASTPALAFRDDLDTGIFSSAANNINFATGGVERLELSGSSTIFNESGADVNFRVEGDTNVNLLFVDAGEDRIGVNENVPLGKFHIKSTDSSVSSVNSGADELVLENNGSCGLSILSSTTNEGIIAFGDSGSNSIGKVSYNHSSNSLTFVTNSSEAFRIDSSGRMLIGITSTSQDHSLLVQASSNANAIAILGRASDDIGELSFFENDGSTKLGELQYRVGEVSLRHRTGGANILFANTPVGGSVTERMRIQHDGKVGIFNTAPKAQLHINSNVNAETDRHDADNYHLVIRNPQDDTGQAVGFGFSITSNDNKVGAAILHERDAGGSQGSMQFYTSSDGTSVSEAMRIDSSQSLLIGGTSSIGSSYPLQVYSATDTRMYLANTTAANSQEVNLQFAPANSVTGAAITCTSEDTFASSSNRTARLGLFTRQSGTLTERIRICSDGDIRFGNIANSNTSFPHQNNGGTSSGVMFNAGTDAANYAVDAQSDSIVLICNKTQGNGVAVEFKQDATVCGSIQTAGSSTSFNTSSDYRLKENITNITDGIARVKQLTPRRFNWISDDTNTLQDGFLAHEAQAVVPEAVQGEKDEVAGANYKGHSGISEGDPVYQEMDYSKLVPVLVAAVKELIIKVETLEAA
tara:strand:+ start:290 stop:2437 length:2148 start_codon:yes stop_codon:yes gene_type:complete